MCVQRINHYLCTQFVAIHITKTTKMNKSRRKDLREVLKAMEKLKSSKNNNELQQLLHDAAKTLEEVTDEEQMSYDNLPENMMWSARADTFTDNLDNLNDAQVDLGLVVEAYDNAKDNPYDSVKDEIASVIRNCTEAIERR